MSKTDKDQVLEQFTAAYQAKHGKTPEIEAKGGWYSVDGGKNVRLSAIEEMTAELTSDAAPAKQAAPAKEKPAPKAKTSAKPAAKKAKSKGGFSVKAYWQEQILAKNPGSKLPR